jgi:hypothetical protein
LFQYCDAGKSAIIAFAGKAVPAMVPVSLSFRNQEVLKKNQESVCRNKEFPYFCTPLMTKRSQ